LSLKNRVALVIYLFLLAKNLQNWKSSREAQIIPITAGRQRALTSVAAEEKALQARSNMN